MPLDVIMPALGMAQSTGIIVSWNKNEGDAVKAGDVLFEVETDKATMEVEAKADGFLSRVTAKAGEEIPVGNVIAVITEAPESASTPKAEESTTQAPSSSSNDSSAEVEGHKVIMPALGMAQTTGVVNTWCKAPGDYVKAGDILFEVETDKSMVEVEAGSDGYVAKLLVDAGEEIPVGEVIAIISTQKPENPTAQSRAAKSNNAEEVSSKVEPVDEPKALLNKVNLSSNKLSPKTPLKNPSIASSNKAHSGQRILVSPKARRIALEEGLDFALLVKAGYPQPYHVAEIDTLRKLHAEPTQTKSSETVTRYFTAEVDSDGLTPFALWAAESANLKDGDALLAGMVAGSLGRNASIAVERLGSKLFYNGTRNLKNVTRIDEETTAEVIIRDLRQSALSQVKCGAEDIPVITITRSKTGLTLTLECGVRQMNANDAIQLLSNFAGRIKEPLRHLL